MKGSGLLFVGLRTITEFQPLGPAFLSIKTISNVIHWTLNILPCTIMCFVGVSHCTVLFTLPREIVIFTTQCLANKRLAVGSRNVFVKRQCQSRH